MLPILPQYIKSVTRNFDSGTSSLVIPVVMPLAVLLLYVHASIQRTYGVNIMGRRLEDDVIKQNLLPSVSAPVSMVLNPAVLAVTELNSMSDTLFETFSAMGTAGMTTGITRELVPLSKFYRAASPPGSPPPRPRS